MPVTAPPRYLRSATPADAPMLATYLRDEGLADDEMVFAQWTTYVLEEGGTVMGFLTLAMAHARPALVHFVVAREHRTPARARFLAKALRAVIRAAGFAGVIVHADGARERRLVEYFFRAMPYALTDDRAFYWVTA